MIAIILIILFVLGYTAIAFEHTIRLNKAASALLTGVLCWTVYILSVNSPNEVVDELIQHLGEISSILFFLLGAMTIVELIDSHNGFAIIINKVVTNSKRKLLIIISILIVFLNAIHDKLTTTNVMISLTTYLLNQKEEILWYRSMIIIDANAGGACSPLGDVTTTMLW